MVHTSDKGKSIKTKLFIAILGTVLLTIPCFFVYSVTINIEYYDYGDNGERSYTYYQLSNDFGESSFLLFNLFYIYGTAVLMLIGLIVLMVKVQGMKVLVYCNDKSYVENMESYDSNIDMTNKP